MSNRWTALGLVAALLSPAGAAHAHAVLTSPTPRVEGSAGSGLKARPCGRGPDEARSQSVTTFQAGETITVEWTETVPHPGYFRISFDADGMDDFVDPPEPRATGYSDTVLADNLHHQETGFQRFGEMPAHYSAEVTLPNIACDNCTLQLIQFMEDKLNDGNPDNDIYYSCADIVLVAADGSEAANGNDPAGDTGAAEPAGQESPDAGADAASSPADGESGCSLVGSSSSSRASSPLVFGSFLLAGLLTRRRRAFGSRHQ